MESPRGKGWGEYTHEEAQGRSSLGLWLVRDEPVLPVFHSSVAYGFQIGWSDRLRDLGILRDRRTSRPLFRPEDRLDADRRPARDRPGAGVGARLRPRRPTA